MKAGLIISYLLLSLYAQAQQFENTDLDGKVNGFSSLPTGWASVPASFPGCLASDPGITDTPDLADSLSPGASDGVIGYPYSGKTFLSALYSESTYSSVLWHEGIQQDVSGFSAGTVYTINFHQAVDKSINCLDESGSWAVYLDNQFLGISSPSHSSIGPFDKNLQWDYRALTFIATKSYYTIRFLPEDDDANNESGETAGSLRMAIDYIYLSGLKLHMPNVLTPNNDGYNDAFVPFEDTNIPQASISIYDRWGYKVYENSGLLPGWDGNQNGNPCTDGVYYYVVSLDIADQKFSFSGFVQVLR